MLYLLLLGNTIEGFLKLHSPFSSNKIIGTFNDCILIRAAILQQSVRPKMFNEFFWFLNYAKDILIKYWQTKLKYQIKYGINSLE